MYLVFRHLGIFVTPGLPWADENRLKLRVSVFWEKLSLTGAEPNLGVRKPQQVSGKLESTEVAPTGYQ